MIYLKKPLARSILFKFFYTSFKFFLLFMLILFHDILLLKVLVVSDIKKELGYIGSPIGHKEWRRVKQLVFCIPQLSYFVCWLFWNFLIALFPAQLWCQVCSRLKAAQIVEEFQAKVNEKVLLKSCVKYCFSFWLHISM